MTERQVSKWMYDGQLPNPHSQTFTINIYRIVNGEQQKPPIYQVRGNTATPNIATETAQAIVARLNTMQQELNDHEARIIARTIAVISRAHHRL